MLEIIKEHMLKTKAFWGHIWPTCMVDLDTIMALLILGLIIWEYWIWCCNGKIYEKPHFFTTMIEVQLKTTNLYSSQNMCYRQQNYLILYTKFVMEEEKIDMKWSVACLRTNFILRGQVSKQGMWCILTFHSNVDRHCKYLINKK